MIRINYNFIWDTLYSVFNRNYTIKNEDSVFKTSSSPLDIIILEMDFEVVNEIWSANIFEYNKESMQVL